MAFIAVCHNCEYETSAESTEKVHEKIKADGGDVEKLGSEHVGRPVPKVNSTEKIPVIDSHCPNGHRLDIIAEENRSLLPLEFARREKEMRRKRIHSFSSATNTT